MTWTNMLAAGAFALVLAGGAGSGFAQMGELVDRDTLRVCADPNHLPFSNEAGEGFENKIAELLAADLGVDVAYTWHPQVIGFVRNTLGARACDLVMGITTTSEVMQNTNPYYRSSYALVQRADAGAKVTSLGDPKLADLRIGAVAQTPPIDVLAQRALLKNVRPYQLMVDTRYDDPGRQMVEDVAAGEIDVGVLWGPIAGYWAKQQSVPMEVVPLTGENAGVRLDFRITMGLRRNEPEWKGILNDFLAKHKAEIQEILLEYGVPLLDERGRPIGAAAATQHGARESVPEPAGYRTAEYRAPVPATLRGATTVTTSDLQALLAAGAPVLIDVLPAPRPPADRAGARIWRDAPRANIPGSVWLPNVGYGELAPEFETWFEDSLARLSGGDRARQLVFYCQAECWMSWNAAKRALALGYQNVVWYPAGTDGWAAAGLPVQTAEPESMPGFIAIETGSGGPQS
jgi:quinoprotein dehydrogenase-associated probable ABC transporter substrate-binding protein/PQQ-dependent catabolism-associated CXXCW motif protein